jgi:hypothetical protein
MPTTPTKNGPSPTAAEGFLFFYIIKHMKTKPDVDWDAVATEAGFKNSDVAKAGLSTHSSHHIILQTHTHNTTPQTRFGQIKRKLGIDITQHQQPQQSKPTGPRQIKSKAASVRRAKAIDATGPVGVTKPTGKKRARVAATVADDDTLLSAVSVSAGKEEKMKYGDEQQEDDDNDDDNDIRAIGRIEKMEEEEMGFSLSFEEWDMPGYNDDECDRAVADSGHPVKFEPEY